jgi:hypothetical protein
VPDVVFRNPNRRTKPLHLRPNKELSNIPGKVQKYQNNEKLLPKLENKVIPVLFYIHPEETLFKHLS